MTTEDLWSAAASAVSRGDYLSAAAVCRRLAAIEPVHDGALQILAVADTLALGIADTASGTRLRRSAVASPGSATAWTNLAAHVIALDGPKSGVPYFGRAVVAEPSSIRALNGLASAFRDLGVTENAAILLGRARAIDYTNADLAYEHAVSLIFATRRAEGERVLHQTIALMPSMAVAHDALTMLAYDRGDFEAARTTVSRECSVIGREDPDILRSIIIDASHPDAVRMLPDFLTRMAALDGEIVVVFADMSMIDRFRSDTRIAKFACTKRIVDSARALAIGMDLAEGRFLHLVRVPSAGDVPDIPQLERFVAAQPTIAMAGVTSRRATMGNDHAESMIDADPSWLVIDGGRWHDAAMNIDGTDDQLNFDEIAKRLSKASLSFALVQSDAG